MTATPRFDAAPLRDYVQWRAFSRGVSMSEALGADAARLYNDTISEEQLERFCRLLRIHPTEVYPDYHRRFVDEAFRSPRRVDHEPRSKFEALLQNAGMSQTELSRRSGVARETICYLASGRLDKIAFASSVAALAWGLGIPIEELAFLTDQSLPLGPRIVHRELAS